MSTSAQTHFNDNCHYAYNEYKAFAENMYRLVRRDLYSTSQHFELVSSAMKASEMALQNTTEISNSVKVDISMIDQATNNMSSKKVELTTMYEKNKHLTC